MVRLMRNSQCNVVNLSLENFKGPQDVRAGIRIQHRGHEQDNAMTETGRMLSFGLAHQRMAGYKTQRPWNFSAGCDPRPPLDVYRRLNPLSGMRR